MLSCLANKFWWKMFRASIKNISPDIDQWAYFKLDGVYIHIGLKPLPGTEDRHYETL